MAFGGVVASVAADNKEFHLEEYIDWRVAFIIPAFAFLIIGLSWLNIDNRFLDNQFREKEMAKILVDQEFAGAQLPQSVQNLQGVKLWNEISTLSSNPVYMLCMSAMVI